MSGRRARGAGAGTPRAARSGTREEQGRAGQRSGGGSGWLHGGSRSPQPRAGVWKTPELLWKCGDAWTRRLRAPAPPAVPPRLSAAASTPARGRRYLLAGRAAGVRAVMVVPPPLPLPLPLRWPLWLWDEPPPSSPKATSLRSNDLYIPGLGFTKCNSQPPARGGRQRRAGRREGPERRGGASRSPRPYPGLGRVQLFPGECGVPAALPQGPKSPQSPTGLGRRLKVVSAFP